MSWKELKNQMERHAIDSETWRSDRTSLVKIFDEAEKHGIDPHFASIASLSNLRSAVAECKRAIRWEDWDFLARVFKMCATLTNVELRLALHIPELQDVHAVHSGGQVNIALTERQFQDIQRKTRLQLRFQTVQANPVVEYYEYQ